MCVILPLVIPVEKIKIKNIESKATVAKLLGLNEKKYNRNESLREKSYTLHRYEE